MHQALLIDEIFENVLDSCSDGHSLSRIARTCRAWNDPALDRLWKRLTCIVPLLNLIPGLAKVDGVYVSLGEVSVSRLASLHLLCFTSEVHRSAPKNTPGPHSHITTIPSTGPVTVLPSANGPTIVDLDLGFRSTSSESSNHAAHEFLLDVRQSAPDLASLSIRGLASERLLTAVSSLSMLRTLSLRLGYTMTIDTLIAISKFPVLTELEVQAVAIDVEEMKENWVLSAELDTFPALATLNIRGTIDFIDAFIRNMRSKHLHELQLDIDPSAPSGNNNTWDALFNAIHERFSNTLHDLTIEYHTEAASLPVDTNDTHNTTNNTPTISPLDGKFHDFLNFDTLYPLSNMRNLRRIMLDTSPPLSVCDQDFDRLVKWWPNLEHLQLGSLPALDPTWTPQTTVKSLLAVSLGLRSLQTLILPVASSSITTKVIDDFPAKAQSPLHHISVTSSLSDQDMMTAALNRLFPSLDEIEIHTES
ncbi:hypothetical protein D9758_007794 [Tetrapyrgos nigripes]|uniref:F-box domain-containing protein n=1 Tax=Tetrapyrgos nigripes TaxID=182062 RepID=A0A8H5FV92_9AGAR|nr:hypothetical protein D9758_007794 [Tetrapyrgos nigripes]